MSSEDQWEVPPLEWSSFNRRHQREIPANSEIGHNSAHDQKIKKNIGTLFPQTLKVEENKVPLVFSILALGLRYSHFLIFCRPHQQGAV